MKNLSKSRYTAFCQCDKNLWLKVYRPELAVIDDATMERFAEGNKVGDLAMGLFGNFKEVTTHKADGTLDLTAMVEKTKQCLDDGIENIAEASFSWNGNYCAVDVLHKQDGGYAIYEVKSSSGLPTQSLTDKSYEKYAKDIAYQKYVLVNCGINVTGTYLVRINKDYVLDGELDIHKFFYIANLEDLVAREYALIPQNVKSAMDILALDEEPEKRLGRWCNKPYECAFVQYCMQGIPNPSVFNLYRMWFENAAEEYYKGNITFDDFKDKRLSKIQSIQVKCTLNNEDYINKEGIRQFLTKLSYPLYFLDFETMKSPIPMYQGTKAISKYHSSILCIG